ncbi:MAG: hypothetical protein U5Q44_01430 [Dehalococcoidia bacterium]|nr:hypothetical protein [Dehalococcoidia bacterium]
MRGIRGGLLAFFTGALFLVTGLVAYAQPGPETERITIESGGEFDSTDVQIPAGWSIEWVNDDSEGHTLHIDFGEDEPFNVGEVRSGESVTIAFDEEGIFGFFLDGDDQDAGTVTVGDDTEAPTNTPQATATPAAATQEPSTVETATPQPAPTQPSDAVAAPSTTETPTPTPAAAQPTPPPPSAGTGGLFSTGGNVASLGGILFGLAAMLLALSSVLHSASRGRVSVYRIRTRRDR